MAACVYVGCGKCYDSVEAFEGFDLAYLDEQGSTILGANSRSKIEDARFIVDDTNISTGYYLGSDDVYYILIDYSRVQPGQHFARFYFGEIEYELVDFEVEWVDDDCFPHNRLVKFMIDNEAYQADENHKIRVTQ